MIDLKDLDKMDAVVLITGISLPEDKHQLQNRVQMEGDVDALCILTSALVEAINEMGLRDKLNIYLNIKSEKVSIESVGMMPIQNKIQS